MEMVGQQKHLLGWPRSLWISLFTGLWTVIRGVIYQLRILPKGYLPVDLPVLYRSPVSGEFSMAFTLLLVTLLGVVAAVTLFAHKGRWRYWAAGTFLLNILAYWYTFHLIEWAIFPPPGVDY